MTRGAAITIALLGTHLALAQPPRWNDTTFDPEVKRRFDWCERMRQVSAGAMSVRDVMRGVNLSVSLPDARTYSPVGFVNIDENGAIKEGKAAGFMVEILDEVAKRAGFTWRDSYAIFDDPEKYGKTWTELVQWQIEAYDMSGEWWVPTVGRRALGVSFLQGFFDSSLILVAQATGTKEPTFLEKFVSWSGPLDGGVWGMVLAFSVCVGTAYAYIEDGVEGSDMDRDSALQNRAASVFSALLLFTGGGGHAPRSFPGQLLLFGWSLCVLVLVNSYAANLVAFLVKGQPSLFQVIDMQDAIARSVPVCVWQGSAAGEVVASKYPTLNVVRSTGSDGLKKMRAGECTAVAQFRDSWRIQQGQDDSNPCCDIFQRGEVLYPSTAGWAVSTDSGIMCTSLIRDVLDIYLVELQMEGFIAEAHARWLPQVHDNTCAAGGAGKAEHECAFKPAGEASETDALGIQDFQGIFIILSGIICLTLLWAYCLKSPFLQESFNRCAGGAAGRGEGEDGGSDEAGVARGEARRGGAREGKKGDGLGATELGVKVLENGGVAEGSRSPARAPTLSSVSRRLGRLEGNLRQLQEGMQEVLEEVRAARAVRAQEALDRLSVPAKGLSLGNLQEVFGGGSLGVDLRRALSVSPAAAAPSRATDPKPRTAEEAWRLRRKTSPSRESRPAPAALEASEGEALTTSFSYRAAEEAE